ncbi:hypothetical protein K435DRAFT_792855 [Dendrothele bispora CBS 962.96]|uniref:T6SS Phospholipase effector Tle1-like catalytic domain-containing protein n=1 Tax=Dendrothele bispora (strain CBS 962.96) TaxID=1314807 RepID=A0A4S8MHA9_DENBC|nr:hypothetical protein K435DRAFT_792855 [Dendrothele bispora CBS 962.96]
MSSSESSSTHCCQQLVPPLDEVSNSGRNVIFLFDGTGDNKEEDSFRVEEEPTYSDRQMVFYRPGIGTWRPEKKRDWLPFYRTISKKVDEAVASNFEEHVIHAYDTLANHYRDGDEICLFVSIGFSRGAYTARAVAAVVAFFGLLSRDTPNYSKLLDEIKETYFEPTRNHYLSQAYQLVKNSFGGKPEDKDEHFSAKFREKAEEFCLKHKTRKVVLEFVGVWDTVSSVGAVTAPDAMFTSSNPHLRYFRHAIALDEKRVRFDRAMWCKKYTKEFEDTDIEQVLTATHTDFRDFSLDVGGGSVGDQSKDDLANISLRWMIRECFKAKTGIIFDSDALEAVGLKPTGLYPEVKPRPAALPPNQKSAVQNPAPKSQGWFSGWFSTKKPTESPVKQKDPRTEEERDLGDALAPFYRPSTTGSMFWGLMEVIPMKKWNSIKRESTRTANWWAGRKIDIRIANKKLGSIKVHRTVKTRMIAQPEDPEAEPYVPAATLEDFGAKIKVDSPHIEWVD